MEMIDCTRRRKLTVQESQLYSFQSTIEEHSSLLVLKKGTCVYCHIRRRHVYLYCDHTIPLCVLDLMVNMFVGISFCQQTVLFSKPFLHCIPSNHSCVIFSVAVPIVL